jgi:hypothetical protein
VRPPCADRIEGLTGVTRVTVFAPSAIRQLSIPSALVCWPGETFSWDAQVTLDTGSVTLSNRCRLAIPRRGEAVGRTGRKEDLDGQYRHLCRRLVPRIRIDDDRGVVCGTNGGHGRDRQGGPRCDRDPWNRGGVGTGRL